jgi:hypothetical protein
MDAIQPLCTAKIMLKRLVFEIDSYKRKESIVIGEINIKSRAPTSINPNDLSGTTGH